MTAQLDAGIRFIDFRIMFTAKPNTVNKDKDWYCLHGCQTYHTALSYLKEVSGSGSGSGSGGGSGFVFHNMTVLPHRLLSKVPLALTAYACPDARIASRLPPFVLQARAWLDAHPKEIVTFWASRHGDSRQVATHHTWTRRTSHDASSTALRCTAVSTLYCTVWHCTALYCTVRHCIALYCTVLKLVQ